MMTLHGGEKEEDVVVVIASTIPPGKTSHILDMKANPA